jgi:hypothetical protein
MEKIEEALTKMEYRKLKNNVWAKPVTFHLFLFEMDKKLWTNFFQRAAKKYHGEFANLNFK